MKQLPASADFLASARRVLVENRAPLLLLFLGVLAPLLLFAQLADEVRERDPFPLDDPILLGIHRHATPLFDQLMIAVSACGSPGLMIFICATIIAWLWKKERRRDALFFLFAVCGAGLLNLAAKLFFERARPALWVSIAPRDDFSFPSGHAMGTMAVVVAACLLVRAPRTRVLAIGVGAVFVFLVGFSRLYLGVHYPSDVVAGWFAALAWVCGLHVLRTRRAALRDAWRARRKT